MTQMDYALLMRRVMAQLALVANGATAQLSHAHARAANDSRILTGSTEIYHLQERWHRAHSTRAKAAVLADALEALRLARVRVKAKYDSEGRSHHLPADAALAVGREAAATSVKQVAMHYGYSTSHVYELRERAVKADKRAAEEVAVQRYDGTLEMRCMIAATPGTARSVAGEFGVSHMSVLRWRRETSAADRERWESAEDETDDWFDPLEDGDAVSEHSIESGVIG